MWLCLCEVRERGGCAGIALLACHYHRRPIPTSATTITTTTTNTTTTTTTPLTYRTRSWRGWRRRWR
jgi:hypothetical protein